MYTSNESGRDFEQRALDIARSIHDPYRLQGAVMHKGTERDALFISEDSIHAYEFTVDAKKAKSQKDAEKVAELLKDISRDPKHALKSRTGWCVTRDEPTAQQRAAILSVAQNSGIHINAISVATLQQRLCNSEEYLRCRDNAPFGSISYSSEAAPKANVSVSFHTPEDNPIGIQEMSSRVANGYRALIVGGFGVGKSHSLRELYYSLRRMHFRKGKLTPFPVYINLRDCVGLKTPAEILRRHAEEIGFSGERSLISAWRAGACVLLLDGFDEIVPTRWLGSAADLKGVRWEAMAAVRRLVAETPEGTGIVACGRSHFFSSQSEMIGDLGFHSSANMVEIRDFDEDQVAEYLSSLGISWSVPDWLPTRPLLMGYLVAMKAISDVDSSGQISQAQAWRQLFDAICVREARILSAVRPDVIKAIISRVATLARSQGDAKGPISMDLMRSAFISVNNRQPDEEGIQLLQRLPGLANSEDRDEWRVFVDLDLAETAYGEDLANYLASPFDEHPLSSVATWSAAASELGVESAAQSLIDQNFTAKAVLTAASRRQDEGRFDSVLADSLRVVSLLGPKEDSVHHSTFLVEGVLFESLAANSSDSMLSRTTFKDCLIQDLDISAADKAQNFPYFRRCTIGFLEGASAIPTWLSDNFTECDIGQFSTKGQTTSGILQLDLPPRSKVALTILKKVYNQRGSGRKEGALSRGLDQASRQLVQSVLSSLLSEGWLIRSTAGRNVIYLPVKGRRAAALKALEKPGDFRLRSE
ncbi:NACHT domain-containing protein [Streptomyces harbinensis]|uniref:NACHT domain-containing protein n=1 Tax=Streptomyces harbinensis TaxID=1176198 RepID=UPI00339622CF